MAKCAHCDNEVKQSISAINRAHKNGLPIFCNKTCFGLSRRLKNPPTLEQRKESKRIYDAKRRIEKIEEIREKKRIYYANNHDREKEREYRKNNMWKHVEYCRNPEYKKYKSKYDRRYRAIKYYGEYAESALILLDLENELDARATRYEIYSTNGTLNKALKRRRELWNNLNKN